MFISVHYIVFQFSYMHLFLYITTIDIYDVERSIRLYFIIYFIIYIFQEKYHKMKIFCMYNNIHIRKRCAFKKA